MWDTRSAYIDNHDGDTVTYLSDLGRDVRHQADVRLAQVFAPEVEPMQPGGAECRAFVRQWHLDRIGGKHWPFLVTTRLVRPTDPDLAHERMTLARFVGDVICIATGESLNDAINTFIATNGYGGGIGANP
jgi:hypothetical protein